MTDMTSLRFSFLFHFIFELLFIFMVMTNVIKIELISTTENWLLILPLLDKFFTNWIVPYPAHSYLVKIEGFK